MHLRDVSLSDRFDLGASPVLLNGTQALVRLMLAQSARDRSAGHHTAGYVTGYRGSPLGAVDKQFGQAQDQLAAADIIFQAGLNEDLAATALWGTQKANLRGEGTHEGVFGLWYGKGPGVDRSGDAMRHANMAGTAPLGGVLMALGDDHTGESSTTCHQSEWALVDVHMPVVSPAGVQEILDFGLYGWALSRYAGVWVGLKLMKDTVESTAVIDGSLDRMHFRMPEFDLPEGGLNIRLGDHWVPQEERLIRYKKSAAEAFSRANSIDRRGWGKPGAKIGFVAAGKNWLDLTHALSLLGIDADEAERLGITTYKVGQVWPLDAHGFKDWAEGLDVIVVVEEKRKLIELQVREALFNDRRGRRVYGARRDGEMLFPSWYSLDPVDIASKIGDILLEEGRNSEALHASIAHLAEVRAASNVEDISSRLPYFCAGCPHNSSTKVPDGSRAGAGIGCHTMALWMDRNTEGLTHMGAEGMNWAGEQLFSTRKHMFQNIGDGTYNHSGILAIRAALVADATITYKILFNDAVAMTGGQTNDGGLTPQRICAELLAMGVKRVELLYDAKEGIDLNSFPSGINKHERSELASVQDALSKTEGVSAIVFVQTCAAEKRRRRKRGQFPDPDKRLFIDPAICEGCGDCGVQSNCVALVPVETPFGRKRAIDQSSCNKDFSCLDGFCPSFVTLKGATPKSEPTKPLVLPEIADPKLPGIDGTCNLVLTGVGGTGVVSIGAIVAMAAHLDGKAAAMIEMAGLAQKGGAVHIHTRLANQPSDISAVRVAPGEADVLIGGDLVVSAGRTTLSLLRSGRSGAVINNHETLTGAFTRDPDFRLPSNRLQLALDARLHDKVQAFDASALAATAMGDSIFSNMMLLGAAWQRGLLPLTGEALRRAIELNGTAVPKNLRAFEIGRWAGALPDQLAAFLSPSTTEPASDDIEIWEKHLSQYQSSRLARRFRALVDSIEDSELRQVVGFNYQKVLAYKDEYEVARLLCQTEARVREQFDGDMEVTYHLAPPILAGKPVNGRPGKRAFGRGLRRMLPMLAWFKFLRGTVFDPFGYNAERRAERALITQYAGDISWALERLDKANRALVIELLSIPRSIRGFGPVKAENARRAAKERQRLRAEIEQAGVHVAHAAE